MKINRLHGAISLLIFIAASNITRAQTSVGIRAGMNS